jgi:hypothetical protein
MKNSSNTNVPLLIAITFDLDPDHFDSSTSSNYKYDIPTWKSIEKGVPVILDSLENFTDSVGNSLKATWFVRADGQIADLFGNPAAMFEKYRETLDNLCKLEHEIAWHPHLYKKEGRGWLQENNSQMLAKQLKDTYKDILNYNYTPTSIRVGENYFSSTILSTIEKLGILYDSTSMPGRKRDDNERLFNWECAMQSPYYPSRDDYRLPEEGRKKLLEIPLSMLPIKTTYDKEAYLRYVDLTFHYSLIYPALGILLSHQPYLVTVSHPGVLLYGSDQKKHGLLNFSIENFKKNINQIIQHCNQIERPFHFVTLSNLGEQAKRRMITI